MTTLTATCAQTGRFEQRMGELQATIAGVPDMLRFIELAQTLEERLDAGPISFQFMRDATAEVRARQDIEFSQFVYVDT